jgi:hypothetical protein
VRDLRQTAAVKASELDCGDKTRPKFTDSHRRHHKRGKSMPSQAQGHGTGARIGDQIKAAMIFTRAAAAARAAPA